MINIEDFKSGEHVQQYEYKSFAPSLINKEWLTTDPEILTLLDEARGLLGELNAFSQIIPNVDFFIRMHILKEATTSSRIEGTRTNMEEALADASDIDPEKRDDWEEVQNYVQAINFAINSIDSLENIPLSNRLLCETHKVLMKGVRGEKKQPGDFRKSQNWIGPSLKHATYIPPHEELILDLMSDLEKFIHNDQIHVQPLIKIAIIHYQFETIHPFLDGNGRLGRLLISLFLVHCKLLVKPALYLSDFFERNKPDYYDFLMTVRIKNDLKSWIRFFLIGVIETANSSIGAFKNIIELKEKTEKEKLPTFSVARQKNAQTLIEHLYASPVVTIKQVERLLDASRNTASTLVKDFEKLNILDEITNWDRNRIYMFTDYIKLFKNEVN